MAGNSPYGYRIKFPKALDNFPPSLRPQAIVATLMALEKAFFDFVGGYASLTGAGETTTPGELTQEGPLNLTDTTGGGMSWFIGGGGGWLLTQSGGGGISWSTTQGYSLSAGQGISVISGQTMLLDAGKILWLVGTTGIQIDSVSAGFHLYTAPNLAGLIATPVAPAWGFTGDGHQYFYPPGGPWTLKV
jgi:hypothetical protein